MSVGERDPHTGHMTTGHEWNGIKELNTPVPKPVWFFLSATVLFSIIYWLLLPAWPVGVTYTRGFLGIDERKILAENLAQAAEHRLEWSAKLEPASYAEVQANGKLLQIVRQSGHTLFNDNCSACHGTNAKGGKGFPNLTDNAWLWGADTASFMETLRVGINSLHPDTRVAQMPSFGRDEMLDRKKIQTVTTYVQSLSDPALAVGEMAQTTAAGSKVFAEDCASCHGENGEGNIELGAPDLTDNFWINGGDRQSIYSTIWNGRQGHMPAWDRRLTELDRKILALYVLDLGATK